MFSWIPPGVLFWLKLLSFSITSVLALLGLLYDFKDQKTRELTKWGRVNLCGLIASFVVGMASQSVEYRNNARSAAESAEKTEKLVEDNQKLLEKVGNLLTDNETLLGNTGKGLKAEEKTDADTQLALRNVDRTMQLAGDTLQVVYLLTIPLGDKKYSGDYEEIVASYKRLLMDNNYDGAQNWYREDTQIEPHSVVTHRIRFGRSSPLIPKVGQSRFLMMQVPFRITFSKLRPIVQRSSVDSSIDDKGTEAEDKSRIALYLYQENLTASVTPKPPANFVGETPMMFLNTDGLREIYQSAYGRAVFQVQGDSGGLLSALDFGGTFMRVEMTVDLPVKFCRFRLKIGPRAIAVPMGEVQEESNGGFVYQLPVKMQQSDVEIAKVREAEQRRCRNFENVISGTF